MIFCPIFYQNSFCCLQSNVVARQKYSKNVFVSYILMMQYSAKATQFCSRESCYITMTYSSKYISYLNSFSVYELCCTEWLCLYQNTIYVSNLQYCTVFCKIHAKKYLVDIWPLIDCSPAQRFIANSVGFRAWHTDSNTNVHSKNSKT